MNEDVFRRLVIRALLLIMLMISSGFRRSATENPSVKSWITDAGEAMGGEFDIEEE